MWRATFLVAVGLLAATGCGGGPAIRAGTINAQGFVHGAYGYRIRAEHGALASPEWVVRSHYMVEENDWQAKRGPDYETTVHFEQSTDGRTAGSDSELLVDLALSHREHSGYIWIESVPLPMWSADRDLGVLAHGVLSRFSRGAQVSSGWGWVRVDGGRFATRVVESETVAFGAHDAVRVTFDLANVDDRELAEGRVLSRVRLLVVRSGAAWMPGGRFPARTPFPMVFVFGYAALPEDFDRGLADFQTLVSRVQWAPDTRALQSATAAVMACAPGFDIVPVQLSVDADGDVNTAGPRFVSDPPRSVRSCLSDALQNVRLTPTGQRRWILHSFGASLPPPRNIPHPEREAGAAPPLPPAPPPLPPPPQLAPVSPAAITP